MIRVSLTNRSCSFGKCGNVKTLVFEQLSVFNSVYKGTVSISVSDTPPADGQSKGSIVFNSNPSLGGPMGWVSLGNAQWANFGVID